ncbi:alpha/beta hydrolase [Streptomyces gilvus]|uniref:alpha/beta hydrolase n=1 Tax=Streptomyces gilvus TaxID=2920937 RepID=UPI001F0D0E54|nr:alpha/beta fold hydrolase [Streptomyces sp. CME 23]MCH5677579.1 alpha/beta fold hydrolase [Streptomyces sp. CME 23]
MTRQIGTDRVRVTELRCDVGSGGWVAGTAFLPPDPVAAAVCLPGGGLDRSYWDLQVTAAPASAYSFARYAAALGLGVITLDHLGTGRSARPDPEPAPDAVAAANASATTAFLASTGLADLPVAGVGHSMGAALMLLQQARHRSFEGLAVLGYPSRELTMWRPDGRRWRLTPETAAASKADVGYTNVGPALDGPLLAAVRTARTPVPAPLAAWVSGPGAVAGLAGRVDVPVFLGFGERDVVADPVREPAAYGNAPSVRLEVVSGSFHCHNLAANRHRLWAALVEWASRITPVASAQPVQRPRAG